MKMDAQAGLADVAKPAAVAAPATPESLTPSLTASLTAAVSLGAARSLLFVPGNRAERWAKALASGADLVCIDLEDAVPPAERALARRQLTAHLSTHGADARCGVRINRLSSSDALQDVLALQGLLKSPSLPGPNSAPAFVMLAKTESAAQLELLAAWLPGVPLVALIESSIGVLAAAAIAQARAPLCALMFGGADLAAELGCEMAWEPLLGARCALVLAAACRGDTNTDRNTGSKADSSLALWDVPCLAIHDAVGTEAETRRVAALGYTGKAVIHPAQVAPVHAGLAADPAALERARRVVAAALHNEAAVMLDGRLVDRPVVLAAQRLLRRATT